MIQMIEIDELSIPRLSTNSVMVARVDFETGSSLKENEAVEICCNGVTLAYGTVNAVFEVDGFPDPESGDNAARGFMADLMKEGLVSPGTAHDGTEGKALMRQAIMRMNERGVGAYRVEYAATWEPEEGWKETIEKKGKINGFKHEDPDAGKFKSAAEMTEAEEEAAEYVNGGTFMHAGNEYTAFGVCHQSGTLQGEAVFSGVEPRIVQIEFGQVKGWKAPLNQDTDYTTVFLEADEMNEAEVTEAYEKAVEACRQLSLKLKTLQAVNAALADPSRSIVVDLTRSLEVIENNHDAKRNRPLADLKAHYVATFQLLAETAAIAGAEAICSFDHVVVDNDAEDDVTCKLAIVTDIDFSTLEGAALSKGKLVYKFGAKGGITTSIPQTLKQSSKTPSQPELFDDDAYRPGQGDAEDLAFPENLIDPKEDVFDPGEELDIPPPPKPSAELGDDGRMLWLNDYGVKISVGLFESLTDAKQALVGKWVDLMSGKISGVKKFPTTLICAITDADKYTNDGKAAFESGAGIMSHGMVTGTGNHFAWNAGYKAARDAAG